MCSAYRVIFMQIKFIFIWKVLHENSCWNRVVTRKWPTGSLRNFRNMEPLDVFVLLVQDSCSIIPPTEGGLSPKRLVYQKKIWHFEEHFEPYIQIIGSVTHRTSVLLIPASCSSVCHLIACLWWSGMSAVFGVLILSLRFQMRSKKCDWNLKVFMIWS